MRKIKDNGRTLVLSFSPFNNCKRCYFNALKCPNERCFISNDWVYLPLHWRETLPSRLSRFIKRIQSRYFISPHKYMENITPNDNEEWKAFQEWMTKKKVH